MGKIIMPKNSALLNEIEAVLQIYYEADGWLSNDLYKARLKSMIGDDQYQSSYTKKAQIPSYFGFTVWEDIRNPQSRRRITESGKRIYEAIRADDREALCEILMQALERVKFGRDNYGCPDSDSDVEPPSLFIRAAVETGYLTYREFAFLLWRIADNGANYTDALREVVESRARGTLTLADAAGKYVDCKPIMILVRWGFLNEVDGEPLGSKRIVITPDVAAKYADRLRRLKIYNVDMENLDHADAHPSGDDSGINEAERLSGGMNVLLYGVPGSGKSMTVEREYCREGTVVERLVFHPDYTNADFIGQILPAVDPDDRQITYEFTAGPFTNILREAYRHPRKRYALIIEEVNRGNAPAIFGDVFQLLDRTVEEKTVDGITYPIGTSEYAVTNPNVAKSVYGDGSRRIRIPSNLSIIATMNSSDQNVFTLDTAFQRRWRMRLVENSFDSLRPSLAQARILDTEVTWEHFCTTVNKLILANKSRMPSAEDKRLGVYFIHERDVEFDDRALPREGYATLREEYDSLIKNERLCRIASDGQARLDEIRDALLRIRIFPEKVIKYLWDDAFRFNPEAIFDTDSMESLEQIISVFIFEKGEARFKIFNKSLRRLLCPELEP